MRGLLFSIALFAAVTALPRLGFAQGVSARFSNQVATIGQDLTVRLEVEDPTRVVARVLLELRRPDQATWTATTARPGPGDGVAAWTGTFPAASVWPTDGSAPDILELRALLYGRRGGLILVVGELDPFEMDALPAALALERQRALTRPGEATRGPDDGPGVELAGYVGAEGRAGSTARARAFIGAGSAVGDGLELLGLVIVGPAFSEPATRSGGGPFVLGIELALRSYTRPLGNSDWNLFVQPGVLADLRLPGLDFGGGLRAGILYWVSPEVAMDASLGGAVMIFGAVAPDGEDTQVGFSGGLRLGIRFGPERRREATP